MKQLLISLLLILFHFTSISQSTIAKIKYEQAEEAYNNGNLQEALIKLDETQKLLGSINPKILYLRIMTQKLLLEKGSYSFGLLDSLRKNTAYYVKNYESNTALEDKFREVFTVYELLTKYPSTKEEYDKIEITKKEIEEKTKAEKKFADSMRWVTTLSQLFFVDGWKLGQSLETAQKNNPAYFLKTKAETSKSFPNLRIITSEAQPKLAVYVNANNKIVGFRKITETKKKFDVYAAEYDFNTQSKFYKNQYNNVFGFETVPVVKNKKEGKYEWTKDGKTVIVSWFRHHSFLDYAEFFEDLIDKSIQ